MTPLPTIPETCGNCRFWKLHDEEREGGFCRRYPPKLDALSQKVSFDLEIEDAPEREHDKFDVSCGQAHEWTNYAFPVTMFDEWCGEWKAIPPEPTDILIALKPLSVRAANIIEKKNNMLPSHMQFRTLHDIAAFTLNDFSDWFGWDAGVRQVQDLLQKHGLDFRK
jgi:hypothetical protein